MITNMCKWGMTDCLNCGKPNCEWCYSDTGGKPSGYLKTMLYTITTEGTGEINMEDLKKADMVNHPAHYNVNGMEVIDIIEGFELPYHLGNVVKYILRAGRKWDTIEDLKKSEWYLHRYIEKMEKEQTNG